MLDLTDPLYTIRGRDAVQKDAMEEVEKALQHHGDGAKAHQAFLLSMGLFRSGKTTIGAMVPRWISEATSNAPSQTKFRDRRGKVRRVLKPLYVLIAFRNGTAFDKTLDQADNIQAKHMLGARVAYAALGWPSQKCFDPKYARHLSLKNVLPLAVAEARTSQGVSNEDTEAVLPVVIHVDEHSYWILRYAKTSSGSLQDAQELFIGMMSAIGEVKESSRDERFFLVPIVTGTARADMDFSISGHGYVTRYLTPSPLSPKDTMLMAREVLEYREKRGKMSRDDIDQLIADPRFKLALSFTSGFPGLIDRLNRIDGRGPKLDWRKGLWNLIKSFFGGSDTIGLTDQSKAELAELVVSQEPARLHSQVGIGKDAPTLASLERTGCVYLTVHDDAYSNDLFRATMPVPYLCTYLEKSSLPEYELLAESLGPGKSYEEFHWKDFEVIYASSLVASVRARQRVLQKTGAEPVVELLRVLDGARNSAKRPQRLRVVLPDDLKLRLGQDSHHLLTSRTAAVDTNAMTLEPGCFHRTAENCPLVDAYFVLPGVDEKAVLVLIQNKHTRDEKAADTLFRPLEMDLWLEQTRAAFASLEADYDVALLWVMNRRFSDKQGSFTKMLAKDENLFIVSHAECERHMPLYWRRFFVDDTQPE